MTRTDKPRGFRIHDDDYATLKALAKGQGIPLNRLINNILRDYVITFNTLEWKGLRERNMKKNDTPTK